MAKGEIKLHSSAGELLTFLNQRPDLVNELELPFNASDLIDYLVGLGIKERKTICDTEHPYVARIALKNVLWYAAPIFSSFNRKKRFGRKPISKLMRKLVVEAKKHPNPWSHGSRLIIA